MSTLLVIDNYDSFTYNLVQMFMPYPLEIKVFRCDKLSIEQAGRLSPDYLLVSPGPKDPAHTGISKQLIQACYKRIPVLGVCLGMQCINEVFGGITARAPVPMHGKTSDIRHDGSGLFVGIPSPFTVARYHSLMAVVGAGELIVTARSDDDVVMALHHRCYPLHGVQFHPESFLTRRGEVLIKNFLRLGSLSKTLQSGDKTPAFSQWRMMEDLLPGEKTRTYGPV